MDLNTDGGIQNFRRSLHIAFKEVIQHIDWRLYRKSDNSIDVASALFSNIDKLGISILRIMKSNEKLIVSPPTTLTTHSKPSEKITSEKSSDKLPAEQSGCGNIFQLLTDDDDDEP